MEIPDGEVVDGQIWASGEGASGSVRLLDGRALWHFTQTLVPDLALYRERYSLWFDDAIVELEFPAPYLNHHQTRLTVFSSDGLQLVRRAVAPGFEEPFVRELESFHDAATGADDATKHGRGGTARRAPARRGRPHGDRGRRRTSRMLDTPAERA